jgi:hypothetical protein
MVGLWHVRGSLFRFVLCREVKLGYENGLIPCCMHVQQF